MRHIIILLLSTVHMLAVVAQSEHSNIRKGNIYYNLATADSTSIDSMKFVEAELFYRKALEKTPESYKAAFNLGDALFKQQKYEEAAEQFEALTGHHVSKDSTAMVYHNLGNSLLMSNKLEDGIEAYKNSLRNNPKDNATRYNLAFAQHMLKKQQDQKQEPQENKDQNKDKDKKEENKDKEQDQDQKKEEQQQQQQEQKISKEDAERMLKALEEDEKKLQEELKEKQAVPVNTNIEKEW